MIVASGAQRDPPPSAGGRSGLLALGLCLAALWGAAAWLRGAPLGGVRLALGGLLSALLLAASGLARRSGAAHPVWRRGLTSGAHLLGLLGALLLTARTGADAEVLLGAGGGADAVLRLALTALPSAIFSLGAGAAVAFAVDIIGRATPYGPPAPAPHPPTPAAPERLLEAADRLARIEAEVSRALEAPAALASAAAGAAAAIDAAEQWRAARAADEERRAAALAQVAAAEAAAARAALGEVAAAAAAARASLSDAAADVRDAARAQIQAITDASTQAVRLFTGVSRHLDQTWDKVQDALGAVQVALEELRRVRGNLDAMAVKLISAESQGRESAAVLDELGQEMEDLRAAVAEQHKGVERVLLLSKIEQGTLSMSLDRIRKLLERVAAPGGSGPSPSRR